jgi:glycogen debranching enzyme
MAIQTTQPFRLTVYIVFLVVLSAAISVAAQERNLCDPSAGVMQLSGVARNWQFLDAVGQHAGIFAREDGRLETWVYPLKLFRDFHLVFHSGSHVIAAELLPHTIFTRPESTSIHYEYDAEFEQFSVCEMLFVPVDQRGAVITLQVESFGPLTVEAQFTPDVSWMWPAGLGDAFSRWDKDAQVFQFGEDQHRFYALAGAENISAATEAYSNNYAAAQSNSFLFPALAKGKATYNFVVAASFENEKQARDTYANLLANSVKLQQQAADYYRHYLDSTVVLTLPDAELQKAYDWARIATFQGLVDDPFAGKGLIAGYNVAGYSRRPGFGWFFGRDSMWTALALDSVGDFATTKAALQFLATYQRPNGKIPHEISQSVKLTDWWNEYVYGTASADGTPLYIIGMDDYVRSSGDVAFAREKWDSLWKAYQFLQTTYAPNGLPLNKGVGHGWIEGGSLLPVSTELYQAGVAVAALRSLADLAELTGQGKLAPNLKSQSDTQLAKIESLFWSPANNFYGYALNPDGKLIEKPSVLGTVPMWFGLLNQQHGEQFLNVLAAPDQQADWGMRIISNKDPVYSPVGYHFGSVWPLFSGWASVAEYRYHRPLPGYLNLRANAQLIFDGALGKATEVLSGTAYVPLATSSSHQIWSSAMIVSPILRGMLGISVDSPNHKLTFAPHVPASWNTLTIGNLRVGDSSLILVYQKNADTLTLTVERSGSDNIDLEFSPAFSLRAHILEAAVNGNRTAFASLGENGVDQHPTVRLPLQPGKNTVSLRFRDDFGIDYPYAAPVLGATSRGLKFVSEGWNAGHDRLELEVAGGNGASYSVPLYGDLAGLTVDGGTVENRGSQAVLQLRFPSGPVDQFSTQKVTLNFSGASR